MIPWWTLVLLAAQYFEYAYGYIGERTVQCFSFERVVMFTLYRLFAFDETFFHKTSTLDHIE